MPDIKYYKKIIESRRKPHEVVVDSVLKTKASKELEEDIKDELAEATPVKLPTADELIRKSKVANSKGAPIEHYTK